MITLTNLSKSYGKHVVLDEINLTFEQGKVYGIVGENGSGKTTLFRCIAGLESYAGKINSTETQLKNKLGYLATNPYFFSKITVVNTSGYWRWLEEIREPTKRLKIYLIFRSSNMPSPTRQV